MKIRSLAVIAMLSICFAACQREGREVAEIKPGVGAVQYKTEAKPYALPANDQVASVSPGANKGPDGAEVYGRTCVACHQMTGQGVPAVFPPLDGSPYVTGDNVERMASIMLYGLMGPINVKGAQFNSAMTPQGAMLNDEELAAVANYCRSSWSNKAAPITAEVFAAVRKKYGARGPFQISELGEEK